MNKYFATKISLSFKTYAMAMGMTGWNV